jgi:curli production assembly/transport component CsgF
VCSAPLAAQDITYEPVSPTFGGNPFNSQHVLGVANANNDFRDPRAASSNSQADIFARQLQSRLLSALSSQIVDAIFGENAGIGHDQLRRANDRVQPLARGSDDHHSRRCHG